MFISIYFDRGYDGLILSILKKLTLITIMLINNNQQQLQKNWEVFSYKISDPILTNINILFALMTFFNSIPSYFSRNRMMLIIFKVRTTDNIIRSISTLQRVNEWTKWTLIEIFNAHWELKSENYHQINIEEIIFNYKIIDPESYKTRSIINKPVKVQRT